jgi:DNA-binding transcriptional ArsR family regulator
VAPAGRSRSQTIVSAAVRGSGKRVSQLQYFSLRYDQMAEVNAERPIADLEDPRYAKALAHPLRVRILAMLAEHLGATLGTVAYHVRTLERLGLIEMVATHQRRGATEHVYSAREHPGFSSRAWMNTDPKTKHLMIASTLSQIGDYATQSAAAGGFDHEQSSVSRHALELDAEGFGELAEATRRWQEEIARITGRATDRLNLNSETPIDAGVVLLMFEATPFSGDAQTRHRD